MPAYSDLRTAVVAVLNGISGIGIVHNRQRLHLGGDWSKFLGLFQTTISGTKQLRGWMCTRELIEPTETDFGESAKRHTFVLLGMMSFQDSADSYGTFQALVDTIIAAFEDETNLGVSGVTVGGVGPCSARIMEEMLGSVLVHTASIEVPIVVIRAEGTA